MKFTKYFEFRRKLPDRRTINDDWIQSVVDNPLKTETQEDGRIRIWGRIEEADAKILRVVLLEDGETIHNAFFDRQFKDK